VGEKCAALGLKTRTVNEGGCRVPICEEGSEGRFRGREGREEGPKCAEEDSAFRERLESDCQSRGGEIRKGVDPRGCAITLCETQNQCRREIMKEAVDSCKDHGGEFITQRDPQTGCIVYEDCVQRGDQRDVYYEDVDRVPDATKLLQVAFKLEELIISLDQLRATSEDIANYWAQQGSPDEGRFRRVAAAFDAIIDDVKAIRSDLKDRLDDLTPEDVEEFKYRIKDISKDRLKEVVYIMLSDSEDVKDLISEATGKIGEKISIRRFQRFHLGEYGT